MGVTMILFVIGALGTDPQRLSKGAGRVENWSMSKDHPNDSIVKIVQNAEKIP